MVTTSPPSGWYPDPASGSDARYWDGSRWSEVVPPAQPDSVPPDYTAQLDVLAAEPVRRSAIARAAGRIWSAAKAALLMLFVVVCLLGLASLAIMRFLRHLPLKILMAYILVPFWSVVLIIVIAAWVFQKVNRRRERAAPGDDVEQSESSGELL